MDFSLLATAITFVVCHVGPANHFAVFAEELEERGHSVHVYASNLAIEKFPEGSAELFYLEKEGAAEEIAYACPQNSVVVTDVGHPFALSMQKALRECAPNTLRLAYYDNPEPYVPGGYSLLAADVMAEAKQVLFANAHFAHLPIYRAPGQEIALPMQRRIGLGYYPMRQAEELAWRRKYERRHIRAQFFSNHGLVDRGQRVLVYAGGNNTEYFSKALPAALEFFSELGERMDFSNTILLLQQHPGAKGENIDGNFILNWKDNNKNVPLTLISEMETNEALVLADAMLYYQTSMAPQFVLAGIPAMQIGHKAYEDILVRNQLCITVNTVKELEEGLKELPHMHPQISTVEKGIGIRHDWIQRLEELLEN